MQIRFSNFYEWFVEKFDTPKNSKLAKISSLKFMFKKAYLSFYLIDSKKSELKISKVGQNFKLEINVQNAISLSIFDGFQQMRAQN